MTINQVKQDFASYADSIHGEACGLIIKKNNCFFLKKCNNISENKLNSYEISTRDYYEAAKMGKIEYSIHSHYRRQKITQFSVIDKTISEEYELPALLYDVNKKIFIEYEPHGYSNDYVGRSFSWGFSDCLSLVCDYYKQELSINILTLQNRDKNIYVKEDLSLNNIKNLASLNDFLILDYDYNSLQEHDILLSKKYSSDKTPSHLSIYINDDKILHQKRDDYSKIEDVKLYNNLFVCIFRHKKYE